MSTQVAGLKRFASRRKTDTWSSPSQAIYVVAGAKGGAGTSTIAALLGLASAADGRHTLLIDTDDVAGTQHRLFGAETAHGIAALQDPAVPVSETLVGVAMDLHLLAGGRGHRVNTAPLGTNERRAVFRRVSSIYDHFDAVFLDAGSRLDGIIAAGERGAWRFITVTGVEPVALASAYAMVKALETRWPGAPIEVLVNQHDETRARAAFEHIRAGAEHFLGRTVQYAGAVPRDAAPADAALAGRPLRALGDAGAAGSATARIAVRLLAEFDDVAAN
jgi:flagellar biosynthesis protein FlhG